MEDCYELGLNLGYIISLYILLSTIDLTTKEARKCYLAEYPGKEVKGFGEQLASSGAVHNCPNLE